MTSATPNSRCPLVPGSGDITTGWAFRNLRCSVDTGLSGFPITFLTTVLSLVTILNVCAADNLSPSVSATSNAVALAEAALRNAETRFQNEPKSLEAAWHLGRAYFDLAEFATSKSERARLAEKGIEASKKAVALDDNCGPAHYYLGMNLGQLARTKGLGALKLVGQLRRSFERACELDEKLEYAGPDRNLGLLYRDAPSWTVGDRKEAQKRLVKAVTLAPDYPDNRLELIEGYLKWGDRTSAQMEMETLEKMWPKLREQFSGSKWELSWFDWQARVQSLKAKIDKNRKKAN